MLDKENKIEDVKNEMPIQKPIKKKKINECKVINYNKKFKTLEVDFNGYGIIFDNVDNFEGNMAKIEYSGEIGKSDFEHSLV